ncbi:hypothetical protein CLAFUW4_08206 [Fulvia fulva]|uniref:Uncharacterized protein n=1 Tax=Passalora fulva TaxID=5499 RepID=A0A9Q8LCI1_PASFU|nr:uncharacterized protein CLAFUR5_08318 [Fulvia fulva]KAK4629642.1 hypothetical protein CLAFUR4_08211 [Fulvia fulva]KAK4630788.1 hypothetical protein CLAFUR0_08206 [Fulvia fulva]UJO14876.1 hypothetical protein CLAFUR5_08318 [Fulvia fulva]WPV12310.1 hypothetical protein CLAFUW4_08206 [Fulvia fulva]WPV27125.1 hypothetical protein CLAFUW7_08206 [Fulvia fulva]
MLSLVPPTPSIPIRHSLKKTFVSLKEQEQQEAVNLITAATNSFIDALNSHNFDPSSPPWTKHHTADYTHTGNRFPKRSLSEWLAWMQATADEFPEYAIQAVDVQVQCNCNTGKAHVFLNNQTWNAPRGTVRRGLAVTEWRRDGEGKWWVVKTRTLRGMGLEDGL